MRMESQWLLWDADGINSRGEIVGLAFNIVSGEGRAFLAILRECGSMNECGALAAQSASRPRATFAQPEHIRKLLQERQNKRFGLTLTKPQ